VARLVLLNTSILTVFGSFTYEPVSLAEARKLVREFQEEGKLIQSAIGHEATADVIARDLQCEVPVNREQFKQSTEDVALIFKLKKRPPEGKILTRQEIEAIGYEFGLLLRTA
jgi:hypothetical protein